MVQLVNITAQDCFFEECLNKLFAMVMNKFLITSFCGTLFIED